MTYTKTHSYPCPLRFFFLSKVAFIAPLPIDPKSLPSSTLGSDLTRSKRTPRIFGEPVRKIDIDDGPNQPSHRLFLLLTVPFRIYSFWYEGLSLWVGPTPVSPEVNTTAILYE